MKIAFFGGSFNPPHEGHTVLAETVLRRGLAERVLFVPAWIPPHKTGEGMAPFEDRLRMTELAVSGRPGFAVSGIEGELGGMSYTLRTLRELSERNPEEEYVLLLGGDSLAQLHTWHRAEDLAAEYRVICCPRPGETPSPDALNRFWKGNIAEKLLSGVVEGFPETPVSSTGIRRVLAAGGVPVGLRPEVLEYIRQRRLYMAEEKTVRNPGPRELARFCAEVADDRKAADIVVMDMTGLSTVSDFYVICTGTSAPHLRAISEKIQRDAREKFALRARVDGSPESNWMIADFGNVMVHVFTGESRELYQLEHLWGDAPKIQAFEPAAKPARSRLV